MYPRTAGVERGLAMAKTHAMPDWAKLTRQKLREHALSIARWVPGYVSAYVCTRVDIGIPTPKCCTGWTRS